MPPRTSDEQLSFARRLRSEMTTAETILWRGLRDGGLGCKFRRQVPIGPFVADFACVAIRLVVELDGEPHATAERQQRDRERDGWFVAQGWAVLRLPNDIVIGGGDIALDRIKRELAWRLPSSDLR